MWSDCNEARNPYSKVEVEAACAKTIADIKATRDGMHEEQIEREMHKRRYFFGRNFTREESITRLKNSDGIVSQWDMIENVSDYYVRLAESIQYAMSKSIGDTFCLTRSEANGLHWE